MKINKTSAKSYDTVDNKNIVRYISEYTAHIYGMVYTENSKLQDKNRATLKTIAAELETVEKQLDYILNGMYWTIER